jgi:precorrin-4 methylase
MSNDLVVIEEPLTLHIENHANNLFLTRNTKKLEFRDLTDNELLKLLEYLQTPTIYQDLSYLTKVYEELQKRGLRK